VGWRFYADVAKRVVGLASSLANVKRMAGTGSEGMMVAGRLLVFTNIKLTGILIFTSETPEGRKSGLIG